MEYVLKIVTELLRRDDDDVWDSDISYSTISGKVTIFDKDYKCKMTKKGLKIYLSLFKTIVVPFEGSYNWDFYYSENDHFYHSTDLYLVEN